MIDSKIQSYYLEASMTTPTKKLQGFRNQLRKRERQEKIASLRYNQQLYLQQLEYQQSGDYGTVLLHSIYEKSELAQNLQELLSQHPLKSFYFMLENTFDNTTHQTFTIKILENYFFHGIAKQPQEEMVNSLLRILQLRNSSLKLILLIFYAFIQEHSEYALFLIKNKKYIQILCRINQAYSNNSQIRFIMVRMWHILSKVRSWNNSLAQLISPLMVLANYIETKEIPFLIQSIINIAKLCPQKVVQKIYKKGILRLCDIYARKFRSVSLHYMNCFRLLSSFITQGDIQSIISFIFDHSANEVAYQEYVTCPSNEAISLKGWQLLKEMMDGMSTEVVHITSKMMESRKILSRLGVIIQQVRAQQDLHILLEFIKIYLVNKSVRPQQIKLAQSIIHKIQIQLTNTQHLYGQQHPLPDQSKENEMQIEQNDCL